MIWVAPKFQEGEAVSCRFWQAGRTETVLEVIEDGMGKYYRTSGGGTYGEGALRKVEEK